MTDSFLDYQAQSRSPMAAKTPVAISSEGVLFTGLLIITGDGRVLADGALALRGSRILAVGPADEIRQQWPLPVVPSDGFMAIPGLINSHTHVPMSFFRGLGHERKDMIETFLFPAEKALTPELVEPLSYSYIFNGLRAGVTCFNDHYYFSEGVGRALDRLGLRGVVGETTADLGGAFPTMETWKRSKTLIEKWPFSSRITASVAPHAADTVSETLLKACAAFAKANDLPLHLHLSQTRGERQRVTAKYGVSPVQLAERNGILGPKTLAVHLISADSADLQRLADTGTGAGFCPASQIIYEKLAPIEEFLAKGIPVAIGTDCAACNDNADMMAELKLTALLLKEHGIPDDLRSPSKVLAMATKDPAKILGLEKTIGSLAAGMAADVVFLRRDLGTEPMLSPETNLIYSLSSQHIDHVMVDGKWVLWQKSLPNANEQELVQQYQQAVSEIRRRVYPK